MEDRQETAIDKYDINVKKRYRSRGGWMLETDRGLKLLREYESVRSHFQLENKIKEYLIQHGFTQVDDVVPNNEGNFVTELETGEKYVLYNWFPGEECDLRSESCLTAAGENLGRLHQALQGFDDMGTADGDSRELMVQFEKHNRELKRVNGYMKGKKKKSEFEIYAINCFRGYYEKAREAAERLEHCAFYQNAEKECRQVSHGDYNYHNLIRTAKGMATTGFEKAGGGLQLLDLTYFMRKTLEKNNWSKRAGEAVLSGYDSARTLSQEQLEFVYIMLTYPEKYWKLMNHYYNKKKSWLSAKSLEKLKDVGNMEKKREEFLKGH